MIFDCCSSLADLIHPYYEPERGLNASYLDDQTEGYGLVRVTIMEKVATFPKSTASIVTFGAI